MVPLPYLELIHTPGRDVQVSFKLIFSINVNYLSPVAFYFPIASAYGQGVPVLSEST